MLRSMPAFGFINSLDLSDIASTGDQEKIVDG